MSFFKRTIRRFAARWMQNNGVSDEYFDTAWRNAFSPKDAFWHFFWGRAVDAHAERVSMRRNAVLSIPDRDAAQYARGLEVLRGLPSGAWRPFLYENVRQPGEYEAGFCTERRLPFVVHKSRRLYFPGWMTPGEALTSYRYFREEEGITGDGILRKHPHCYETADFKVEEGDIVLDVGCSEGLFALDAADRASKVYAFETLRHWREPNRATFAPFGDKVRVVNKFVGGETIRDAVRLEDAVDGEGSGASFFLKMDIEGGERTVLAASERFLTTHRVKLACAAYHRQDDAEYLSGKLRAMGFDVSFSDGYVLPLMREFEYPYFRKTFIRARNYG